MSWPQDNLPINPYSALPVGLVSSTLDLMGEYLGIPPSGSVSPLLTRFAINPHFGPIYWLGASYEDNGFNYNAVQSLAPPTTVSGSWAALVNSTLGQPNLYRWTTAGSVPGSLGQIYAVSGASWGTYITSVNTSITTQCAKLIADYPNGLPANSIVVIHCGINELQNGGALNGGGIFSADGTTVSWAQSGFTMPAANANINVAVTNSAQCVAGSSNLVLVNSSYLMTVEAVPDGTHITLTNSGGATQGTVVPAGTIVSYCAAVALSNISQAQTGITNLLAAGASQIVFVICPNLGQLPNWIGLGQATLATTTWTYWKTQVRSSIYPNTAKQVMVFDMSAVTNNITNAPTAYGLKDSTTEWNSSASINQNDLMWYDGFHQNAPPHVEIGAQFFAIMKRRGYFTLY